MAATLNFRIFAKSGKHKIASISLTVRGRVISSKFLTLKVSKQYTAPNFQKNFFFPKIAAVLIFRIFARNAKKSNFVEIFNHRVSKKHAMLTFGIFFFKNGCHFEFSNFAKVEKHKIASISLTVRDRAISSKFSIHRVSNTYTVPNFHKMFFFPKMAAILNFRQKCKNTKMLLSP